MKNDKLLTELRRIEADLLARKEPAAYIALQNLIIEVEEEIRDECNKESGKGTVGGAAKRILKSASQDTRECIHKAFRGPRGLYICDGFRAIRFNPDAAPKLIEHPEGYEKYPDIDRIIKDSKGNTVNVEVPSINAIHAFIKTQKAKLAARSKEWKHTRLILTDGAGLEIHVDAQFLLDMLEALPGATVTAARQKTQTSALYFKAENGDGALLPLRPPKKDEPV